ncbi:hypothetical protein ACQPXH_02590 [Nocardia sp. CA-135953]|uniref:hypothetical protein n=1 Tax=Nocardia sp. CA-135953 TaxID=3239978 RepID=UPI003D99752E
MADNTSETDQIIDEMAGLTRRVNQVIASWRVMHPRATRVPRSVRREINALIKSDAADRKFAHAQERRRMTAHIREYRWRLVNERQIREWDTPKTWFDRQRELDAARTRIETGIYATRHLTATERGQAMTALATVRAYPSDHVRPVFRPARGLDALRARTRDGITRLRAGIAAPAEQRRFQQWEQLHRECAAQAALAEQTRFQHAWSQTIDLDEPIPMVPVDLGPGRGEPTGRTYSARPQQVADPVDRNHRATGPETAGDLEPERRYEAVVGSAEILRTHPDMARRTQTGSLAQAHGWALDQLADDRQGWPAEAELVATISHAGAESPIYHAAGPRGMVIDEVTGWHIEPENTALTEVEQLRAQLHAARAENDQLHTENTELVRKFADHDMSRHQAPAAGGPVAAAMPRPTGPIFHGPVITKPVLNGLDR